MDLSSDAKKAILSEEKFIQQLQENNKQALFSLYNDYAAVLFGSINRMIPSSSHAETVLQQTFCKIITHISAYSPSQSRLLTWMIKMAWQQAADYLQEHPLLMAESLCKTTTAITQQSTDPQKEKLMIALSLKGFSGSQIDELLSPGVRLG